MTKVFIDGSSGTTGLRIHERLACRGDIELIYLEENLRKDPDARRDAILLADIAFLCLPDEAARQAAGFAGDTVIIDASTAHRTDEAWAYGFPEIKGLREKIASSNRIANPGCHAGGFISLIAPLISEGLLSPEAQLMCFSLTGYSGGGKDMIADYEAKERDGLLKAPRMYAMSQSHKHLPEMTKITGLRVPPIFCPVVGDFYSGMEVAVGLHKGLLKGSLENVREVYKGYYSEGLVRYSDEDEAGYMSAQKMSGRDDMIITACGNEDRILLISRFDNLGKGASGAAIQNMNLIMGTDERYGLNIP
ncbi:MAG: N-acetyl-gamma-glutamyl-phosphate reductase [Lachnospiraceae bacterium]|jgi:N-acetyl-gamma-glutamyl-phosphate reductase